MTEMNLELAAKFAGALRLAIDLHKLLIPLGEEFGVLFDEPGGKLSIEFTPAPKAEIPPAPPPQGEAEGSG